VDVPPPEGSKVPGSRLTRWRSATAGRCHRRATPRS
jgi:hypothetical protein